MYDDVISGSNDSAQARQPVDRPPSANNQNSTPVTNGSSSNSTSSNNSGTGRRYQLYIGNLTWVSVISCLFKITFNLKLYKITKLIFLWLICLQWTTDQDITDSVTSIGVSDFIEVKFFENRGNGQSKGFCVVTLGSEHSLRLVMDRLPKKELHGQSPVVTFPTKQALLQVL